MANAAVAQASELVTSPGGPRPAVDGEPAITCRNVSVRFFTDRRSVTALSGIDLDVHRGELLTLLGPSGCGKSTLLRVLNRMYDLYPGQRATGEVWMDDENIIAFSKRRVDKGPDGEVRSEDTVIVVANLDPHSTRESTVHLDMPALGLGYEDGIAAQDLLTGASWHWGEHVYVRLGPETEPVHIVAIRRF